MKINDLKEVIREVVNKVLAENAPVKTPNPVKNPDKEKETPNKPGKPRRDLNPKDPSTLPNVNPKAKGKKAMNEEEMLQKIVARFKSKK